MAKGEFSKEVAVLTRFFQGNVRNLRCFGLLTCQGNLWNQSETVRTSKKLSGMSKTAKWVIFKGDSSLDALFSRSRERLKFLWTSHMSGYLTEPITVNEEFKEAVRNA